MLSHTSEETHRRSEAAWLKRLMPYRRPSAWRGVFELLVTAAPLAASWVASWLLVANGICWGLLLTVPAAAFLLRLFMIQHDCGHGAFFGRRALDDWLGRVLGVFTLTPYDCLRRTHAIHHASSGNLDARGIGDIRTLTLGEYRALGRWGRLGYWLYRNPVVMFGLGPVYIFVLQQRLPVGVMRGGRVPWVSTMSTNVAIVTLVVALVWLLGLVPFVLVQAPIVVMAGTAGVWLFYVQHQFEHTHWSAKPEWQFENAALQGSSFDDLPKPFHWLTANIGVHHVHHLSSRVPYYRLPQVLRDFPELAAIGRVSILESLRGVRLVLWDEAQRRLISFREARLVDGLPLTQSRFGRRAGATFKVS
jgi:omega-6 fatty acid desaturase (delta-12 desaturase)